MTRSRRFVPSGRPSRPDTVDLRGPKGKWACLAGIAFHRVRVPVALLLCPLLGLQACATTSPIPPGAVLSRSATEGGVELKADPDTASHFPNAEEVTRLRDTRVIPVSLVIRNVGTDGVIVRSAAISLQGSDGRVFPVAEGVQQARAPAVELEERTGLGLDWIGDLGTMHDFPPAMIILMVVVGTMPLWLPPYLIARHVKQKSREQRLQNGALARLESVRLAEGQAAGGVFYFAVEGDLPPTLATTTLIVPVRHVGTGEERHVRLPLGKAE